MQKYIFETPLFIYLLCDRHPTITATAVLSLGFITKERSILPISGTATEYLLGLRVPQVGLISLWNGHISLG